MKILAIDYGGKRVGLALGDTETKLALPSGMLENLTEAEVIVRLQTVVETEKVEKVIVGEPIGLRGKESEQTKISRQFASILSNSLTVPVELFDERFTSLRADTVTLGAVMPTRQRDELAAMFLLQDYLERTEVNK